MRASVCLSGGVLASRRISGSEGGEGGGGAEISLAEQQWQAGRDVFLFPAARRGISDRSKIKIFRVARFRNPTSHRPHCPHCIVLIPELPSRAGLPLPFHQIRPGSACLPPRCKIVGAGGLGSGGGRAWDIEFFDFFRKTFDSVPRAPRTRIPRYQDRGSRNRPRRRRWRRPFPLLLSPLSLAWDPLSSVEHRRCSLPRAAVFRQGRGFLG